MAIAIFALPAASLANTYHFVDTSGDLQSINADSSNRALATAPELGVHSGVVLISEGGIGGAALPDDNTSTHSSSDNYYQFINTSGDIQGLWASSPSIALNTAYQLGIHSGVVLVD